MIVAFVPIPHKYDTLHFLTYIVIRSNKKYSRKPTQMIYNFMVTPEYFTFFWKNTTPDSG